MGKLSERFEQALTWAAQLHAEQERKSTGIPYVSHLMSVCALALEHGADEDEAIAALLHDAVEDQGGQETLDEIRARFGDRVAEIVDGCTDAYVQPKPPWRERKEAYVAHLQEAPPSTCLVSGSDKLHNARCILADLRADGPVIFEQFRGKKDGTLWYYQAVVAALRGRAPDRLVDELARTVDQMVTLARE